LPTFSMMRRIQMPSRKVVGRVRDLVRFDVAAAAGVDLHRGYAVAADAIRVARGRDVAGDDCHAHALAQRLGGPFQERGLARAWPGHEICDVHALATEPLSVGLAFSELSCKTSRATSISLLIPDLPRAKPLLGLCRWWQAAARDRPVPRRQACRRHMVPAAPRHARRRSCGNAGAWARARISSGQPSTRVPRLTTPKAKLRVSGSTQVSSPSKRRMPTTRPAAVLVSDFDGRVHHALGDRGFVHAGLQVRSCHAPSGRQEGRI